jgi:hypothetical protein
VSATTIRYGRHGGGWLHSRPAQGHAEPPDARSAVVQARALLRVRGLWFDPERIPQVHAHTHRHRGVCANDTDRIAPCDCVSAPVVLAAVWAGRARVAAARAAAGQPLDDTDPTALTPPPSPGADPR